MEYIWCKLRSKHKAVIEERLPLTIKAKDNTLSNTRQVRFVKMGNVEQHLSGIANVIALTAEAKKRNPNNIDDNQETPAKQP